MRHALEAEHHKTPKLLDPPRLAWCLATGWLRVCGVSDDFGDRDQRLVQVRGTQTVQWVGRLMCCLILRDGRFVVQACCDRHPDHCQALGKSSVKYGRKFFFSNEVRCQEILADQ